MFILIPHNGTAHEADTFQGLNLVAQIVKSQGGTVHVRSSKGMGTTIRMSMPLRRPPLALTTEMSTNLMSVELSSASVRFLGFGATERDSTMEPLKSEADNRLFSNLKRCCEQLGLSVRSPDDGPDNTVSVFIVQGQEIERYGQTDGKDARRTLLSTDNFDKPMVVLCTTRDSALRLRSVPIAASLPGTTQYLWLPIGPAKLAAALSACCMYYEQAALDSRKINSGKADLRLVNPRADAPSSAALLHATQPSSSMPNEGAGISAYVLPRITKGQPLGASKMDGTVADIDAVDVAVGHEVTQMSQPSLYIRRGSDAVTRPSTPPMRIRKQIDRAMTAPYRGARALSLLLVDDNVSTIPRLLIPQTLANQREPRPSIFAFSKFLPIRPATCTARRRMDKKPLKSTKAPSGKILTGTTPWARASVWLASRRWC